MARKKLGSKWGQAIKSTSDVAERKLKILLWGGSGVGKTHFLHTCPDPFVIAAENGVLTLHKYDIPYFLMDDTMAIYDTFLRIVESAVRKEVITLEDGKVIDFGKIKTIGLDSAWMLNSRLTREIKEETGKEKFQHDEWGKLLDRMQECIMKLLEADFHVVCTMGEAVKADEMNAEKKEVTFNMQGSFRNQIPYMFDFNISMIKEPRGRNTIYKAFTNDENNRSAKSRVEIQKEIVDPTFQKIYDPVMKALKG